MPHSLYCVTVQATYLSNTTLIMRVLIQRFEHTSPLNGFPSNISHSQSHSYISTYIIQHIFRNTIWYDAKDILYSMPYGVSNTPFHCKNFVLHAVRPAKMWCGWSTDFDIKCLRKHTDALYGNTASSDPGACYQRPVSCHWCLFHSVASKDMNPT